MVRASIFGSNALYSKPKGSCENSSGAPFDSADESPEEFGELHPTNVFNGLTPKAVVATVAAEKPMVVRKKFLLLVVAIMVKDLILQL